jgi:DNA-binding NarL/FixJ family response regulator
VAGETDKLIKNAKAANQKVAKTKDAYMKATTERAEAIAAAIDGGVSQNRMARELGLTVARVRQILERHRG